MRTITVLLSLCIACAPGVDPLDVASGVGMVGAGTPKAVAPAVRVGFSVDDRENRIYGAGDLKWKGSFLYDAATQTLTFDPAWTGALPGAEPLSGWPTLYDDGSWTRGGHEPEGAQPGDHVWGISALVTVPDTEALTFEYGLIDATYERQYGNGWIWSGLNGHFTVAPDATGPITAPGIRFDKYGKTNLRLVLDTRELAAIEGHTWDTSFVGVKSSWWGWGVFGMADEGDGVYAFDLGKLLALGALPHTGFLKKGAAAEFVFVLGEAEYKGLDGAALLDGVKASMMCNRGHGFVGQPVSLAWNGNALVVAPPCGQ